MKYLGVDFGLKKVGLAISEGELTTPLKVIEVSSLGDAIIKMIRIIKAEKITQVVVGMPEGSTGRSAKKFIDALKKEGIDVELADETLSTQNASKLMVEMGVGRRKRRQNDAQAAAEILQNYLDNGFSSSSQ